MPPTVEAFRHGYQYMSENTLDHLEPVIMPIRHALIGVGLPLLIVEAEWGPGQIEISLEPLENMTAADAMILLRGAVKQVCRRMQGAFASGARNYGTSYKRTPRSRSTSWCIASSNAAKPLFQHLRLFDRRLRNVSQRPNVSQPRSNSRSTDRPPSHGLTKG
jgi:hypothetical protein